MKRLQINLRSIVIKILFLLLFVVSGCSQRNSRDEKSGPFKQKIIVANRTDEKTANSDTIKLIDLSLNKIVCVKNKLKIKKVPGPFKTNVEADSICWELVSASQGIAIEPERGKGDNCNVTFIRENRNSTGVIILKATPFKALFISKPAEVKYLLQKCREIGRAHV